MKKLIPVFCLFGWIATDLNAQGNTVVTGDNPSGSGGSVSYTVGQIDYSTKTGTAGTITEGVQQPYEILITSGIDEKGIELNARVYPNPASDFAQLSIHESIKEDLYYELVDLSGKSIYKDQVTGMETKIDVASLAGGTYYLKVTDKKRILKTFQVNKIN